MNFEHSDKVGALMQRLAAFMEAHVYPNEEFIQAQIDQNRRKGETWSSVPLLEELKSHARAQQLWNLFLPNSQLGAGLTNLEYAPIC